MPPTARNELSHAVSTKSSFPPEFDLLRGSCTGGERALEHALHAPIHWERALKQADHHRLLPALHSALRDRSDVPASIQSAIRARFDRHTIKALRFTAELSRVLNAFAEAGIEALAHKGPALAQVLYGDAAMRQYGDLDVLVRARDVARAKVVLLKQLGYMLALQLTARQERAYLRSGNDYVFGLGGEPNLLELKWQVLPPFFAVAFDVDAMFRRAIEFELSGFRQRILGREDLLLALCAHAAKHAWAHLGMLRDIAKLASSDLDWDWLKAEAGRLGMIRIMQISLSLASRLLPEIENHGHGRFYNGVESPEVEAIVSAAVHRLARAEEVNTSSMPYFREFMRSRERVRDRVRFTVRRALMPNVAELASVQLPDALFALYPIMRLRRLAQRLR